MIDTDTNTNTKKKSKITVRDLFNWFTTGIFGLSILILAASIVIIISGSSSSGDNPQNETHFLGIKPIGVTTTAMEPAIKQNSIVFFKKIAPDKLDKINVGDIVLRTYNDYLVIRRVVRKTSDGELITKADNRLYEDSAPLSESSFTAVILFQINQ